MGISAAMKRFVCDDSKNELYTRFRYQPIAGLGYEPGVGRRDPSTIIRQDDLYYVWYTRTTVKGDQWRHADIWYAVSGDGITWEERGPAVTRKGQGGPDWFSVFTTNILVANGVFYLVYQATDVLETEEVENVVGMSRASTPDGPWEKLPAPILETSKSGFDSRCVHDPGILVRDDKYWLYYKGHGYGGYPSESKWGVAISDAPEGPYIKHDLNPITNSGHEIWVWPWKSGVAAMIDWAGPEKGTVQFAEDGVNFEVMAAVEDIPPAGGAYIPDKFANTSDGQGFTWGLCHFGGYPPNFLLRFDCDMKRNMKKNMDWSLFRHYSTVRDVLTEPVKYGIDRLQK